MYQFYQWINDYWSSHCLKKSRKRNLICPAHNYIRNENINMQTWQNSISCETSLSSSWPVICIWSVWSTYKGLEILNIASLRMTWFESLQKWNQQRTTDYFYHAIVCMGHLEVLEIISSLTLMSNSSPSNINFSCFS